jgi:hypothetical protein
MKRGGRRPFLVPLLFSFSSLFIRVHPWLFLCLVFSVSSVSLWLVFSERGEKLGMIGGAVYYSVS